MRSLNAAQIHVLRAAAKGDLYRTDLGNYRISGHRPFHPAAYGLVLVGLLERSGERGVFLNWAADLVEGEPILPTSAGHEALQALGIRISNAA